MHRVRWIAILALGMAGIWLLREAQIEAAPMLPMSFAHRHHGEVNCLICHHNYADDSGQGLCLQCHKSDPEIARQFETMFHDLCRDCHIERQRDGLDGGPTRACFGCHEGDDEA